MIGKKVIVAYLRLSIEDGDDRESQSISNQRKIIERYAKENELTITKFYIDDGCSGYKMSRPNFDILMRDLNEDKVDIIIVKDLSRIGRHNAKVQLFLENVLETGKQIIAVNDNYDTCKEETHTMAYFQTVMNEMYVKDISKKIKSSLISLQKEGKLLSNYPYGYYKDYKDKTKCHVDQNIAPYVRQIFDMYINGMGLHKIAKTLTNNNVPTAKMVRKQRQEADGKPSKIKASTDWDASAILRILQNEFYIGTLVLNKTKTRSIKGKQIRLSKDEYLRFEGHHEAIIDTNTFKLTQDLIRQRTQSNFKGKKNNNRQNLFASIIRCADCGAPLTVSGAVSDTRYVCSTYNRFGTTRCSSHVMYEQSVLEVLLDLLADCRNNLQDVLKDLDSIIQAELKRRYNQDDNQYDLVQMLDNTKKSLETLIEMKMKEMIKNPSMSDIIDKTYEDMIKTKYQEIQSLERQILDQKDLTIDEDEIKSDVGTAISMIDDILKTKDVTRKQILMLVDRMVAYEDGGLDIFLKGKLHELSHNYFKVNETTLNKNRVHLYEFIAAHPEQFTKGECTLYVKDKGIKTSYKVISNIINDEIGDMVEYSAAQHGYRLIKPIEDVERVLLKNNIIVDTTRWLCHNNDIFEILISISKDFGTKKYLF